MTDEADVVVLGSVVNRSSRWTENSLIYTDVVVAPDVTLKGTQQSAVVVTVPGGIVGDTQMTVSDAPEMVDGERVLLFLKRDNNNYSVVGRSGGKFQADADETATAVDRVLTTLERGTGRMMHSQRMLAEGYLRRRQTSNTPTTDQLVTSGTGTTTTGSGGCYISSGNVWYGGSAAYSMGSTIPAGWATSINAATTTWNKAGAAFTFKNDQTSTNQLSFVDLVAKYGSSYSNTYAVTTTWSSTTNYLITKATIEINTKFQWSTSGQANMADVQNILTHEFGHWLRLNDIYSPTTCSAVTMWGTAPLGETAKRTLEQPDIDGIISMYGRGSSSTTLTGPTLASPANGATGVSTGAYLTWNAVSGASSYDVYLGTSTTPALAGTVTTTSYKPASLAAGVKYYWRVVAKNSTTTATSATWSFTTATSGGTTTTSGPILYSPANGATGVSLTPTMKWSAVSGATAYDVYVGTTSSPSYIGTITNTAVQISGFGSNTVYYWKIVARGSFGSASSASWWFRTQ